MKNINRFGVAIGSILLASTLSLGMATAQETDAETRLSTVIVTAQKLEENIQDVPISITNIADEKLDNLKASGADVRFLSARVPSVIAESSFGRAFPRFYIRGIGNTDFDLNSTQPVSLVYDDVPYESPILKGFPVFDVEGIEVLRGPQGTLFGRNTPGGIIKFDSVKPSDEWSGYVRGSYGRFNTVDVEAAIGGPIFGDELTFRASGLFQTRDDYVDNIAPGNEEENAFEGFEEFAGRFQLLFAPDNTGFSGLLNVHARSNDGSARLFRANIIDPGSNGIGSNFDRDAVQFDGDNFLTQDTAGVTATLKKDFGDNWEATYIFGYENAEIESRGDIDGGAISTTDVTGSGIPVDLTFPFNDGSVDGFSSPGLIIFASESSGAVDNLDQITHEVRLAYNAGGPLRGQVGAFFFNEEVEITSRSFNTLAAGRPLNGEALRSNDTASQSVFASLSYDVTEALTLSGGARWTNQETDFVAERLLSPFGAGPLGPFEGNVGDDQISWDASATYAFNEDINVYGRVAKGFRAPSVQGRLVFGNDVSTADSETVLSYEAGVKSELWDNRIRLNTNIYFLQLDDQQLTIVGGLDNTVQLFNADESEGYGFEADIEAAPIDNLFVTAGLSYNKTEFKDDVLLAPGCGAPLCTVTDPAVIVQTPNGPETRFNISSNSFPNAPEWIANVTARYAIPTPHGEFYGFTDWAYKGDTNFFLYESLEFGQDGYWEGGLRLGYQSDRGYEASLFARNILDEDALTGGIDFNNLTGFVNEPRTWGIELRYDW